MRASMLMAVVVFCGAMLVVGPVSAQKPTGDTVADVAVNSIENATLDSIDDSAIDRIEDTAFDSSAGAGNPRRWFRIGNNIFYTAGSVGVGTRGPILTGNDAVAVQPTKLPTHCAHVATVASPATGRVYCIGGCSGASFINQILEYNPANSALAVKSATLPTGRWAVAAVLYPPTGKVYCFGGQASTGSLSQILEYNPATDSVAVKSATLPTGRREAVAAFSPLTGKIYCFGGYNSAQNIQLSQIVEYDPTTDTVAVMSATLPSVRSGFAAQTDGATGKIYCLGGASGPSFLSQIVEYNPAANAIVVRSATLPSGRWGMASTFNVATGTIFCFGGLSSAGYLDQVVEYDPATNTLATRSGTLPRGERALTGATDPATGKMYCFGGYDGTTEFDEIIAYSFGSQVALQVGNPGDGSVALANNWSVFSSRGFKRDIAALRAGDYQSILERVNATDVVRFCYVHDAGQTRHLGVIAEDAPREIVTPGGQAVSLADYDAFLLAAIKAQQSQLKEKDCQLDELRARVETLETLVSRLSSPSSDRAK
jgi:N-acetylneuraminic acid mutarotase